MRDVTLAQTRGPVKPARRAPRDTGERAAPPARHASGSLREPPLASPRAAHRAVERAAGPRREVSDDRAGGACPASPLDGLGLNDPPAGVESSMHQRRTRRSII